MLLILNFFYITISPNSVYNTGPLDKYIYIIYKSVEGEALRCTQCPPKLFLLLELLTLLYGNVSSLVKRGKESLELL